MAATDYMGMKTLVTASEVISASMTNSNTDVTLIKEEVIKIAELAHIREPLGADFYDYLKTENDKTTPCWNATIGTCTLECTIDTVSSYKVLVDNYLKPCLAWFVKFEVLNDMQYNSGSAGIVSNVPEFSEPVNPKVLNAYKQDVYRKAKVLLDTMLSYLNDPDNDGCFGHYKKSDDDLCINDKSVVTKNHGMIIY
tara:strand:+ start:87 stop:674 length:588 start_codon:yes stop_codon:yes gene_type:complete